MPHSKGRPALRASPLPRARLTPANDNLPPIGSVLKRWGTMLAYAGLAAAVAWWWMRV